MNYQQSGQPRLSPVPKEMKQGEEIRTRNPKKCANALACAMVVTEVGLFCLNWPSSMAIMCWNVTSCGKLLLRHSRMKKKGKKE